MLRGRGWDETTAKPDSLVIFVSFIGRYGDAFHELLRLGSIAVALPVNTASCERSFSALRHIKTWVRNSISNGILADLVMSPSWPLSVNAPCPSVMRSLMHLLMLSKTDVLHWFNMCQFMQSYWILKTSFHFPAMWCGAELWCTWIIIIIDEVCYNIQTIV